MIRVILTRHGETAWNRAHRLQGQSEVELAESGVAQAQAAGVYVRSQDPAQGYVSTLGRTQQTFAHYGLDIEPVIMPELIEQNLGDWEGMKTAAAKSDYPDQYRAWKAGTGTPPSGEAPEDVVQRMVAAFCTVVRQAAEAPPTDSVDSSFPLRTVVMVSHGTSCKALLEGLGLIDRTQVISLTAAAISVIDVPLHSGPLSSSLPRGGTQVAETEEEEASIIRALTDEQIISQAKLRLYNLSPEVLAAAR